MILSLNQAEQLAMEVGNLSSLVFSISQPPKKIECIDVNVQKLIIKLPALDLYFAPHQTN